MKPDEWPVTSHGKPRCGNFAAAATGRLAVPRAEYTPCTEGPTGHLEGGEGPLREVVIP